MSTSVPTAKATGWRRITARGAMRAPPTRARASGTPSSMRRHLARLWSHPPEEKDQRDARQAQEGDQPDVVHVGEQRHLAKELLGEDGEGLIGGHIGPAPGWPPTTTRTRPRAGAGDRSGSRAGPRRPSTRGRPRPVG